MKRIIQLMALFVLLFTVASCDNTVQPHEHVFSDEYVSNNAHHWFECECGEIRDTEEHTFSEWEVGPNDEGEDVLKRFCVVCKYGEEKEIPPHEHNYVTETKEATCTEAGYSCVKCDVCGEIKEEKEIPALDHDLIHHEGKEATCKEGGYKEYDTCSRCNYSTYEETKPLEHVLVHHEGKEATCTEAGHNAYDTCENCDFTTYEEIPALEHDLEHHLGCDATCTEPGYEAYDTCSRCDYNTYQEIKPHGHEITQYEAVPATCTEPGHKAYEECSRCKYSTYEEIPVLDHDLVQHEAKEATCTEPGHNAYEECSKCDYTTYEEVNALGHDIVKHEAKESTCTEPGHNAYEECSKCDYTTYEEVKALGHDIVEHEAKEATCTEPGHKAYEECSRCDYTTYEEVKALGHDIVKHEAKEATCTEPGHNAYEECSKCDYTTYEEIPTISHVYSEYELVKKPTCSEEGLENAKCSMCGDTIEKSVAKVAHTFSEWAEVTASTCKDHGTEERTCYVCSEKETREAELGDHNYGEWVTTKKPTIYEEGISTATCTVCSHEKHEPIEKLEAFTIVVSGGTVNLKGENKDQSTILVGAGEIVEIVAREYEGYTFYQWFSDGPEIIPTSTFELCVTRDTYFYICFEEGLDYGEWVAEQELTCTEDGLYTRTDSVTGLKQFMVVYSRGHEFSYEREYEVEPTCTTGGRFYYECYKCGEKEYEDVGPDGHNFSGEEKIIEVAHGAKVGKKEISCIHCDATTIKEYISAVHPSGDIKVTFNWDNRAYVSSADREELHYMLDDNKYLFYVMRDASGHSSGNYVHCYFYFEDLGEHSPVYIKKMVGSRYNPSYAYGTYGWGIATYLDSYDEFIEYIKDEHKGSDNGLNNSDLHYVYGMWEDIFNEAGCIPESYTCSGIVDYLGYQCRVYSNGNFSYYVNEDNCCLYFTGLGYNRDMAYVEKIEQITEIPDVDIDIDRIKYITIEIEDGRDYQFTDNYYFHVESLLHNVEITESTYIPETMNLVGYEIKDLQGNWVKLEGLAMNGNSTWTFGEDTKTYLDLINEYLDGVYPDALEIRGILVEKELPVTVYAENTEIYYKNNYYDNGSKFLGNVQITLYPEYDSNKYSITKWLITIDGVTTEILTDDGYSYYLTLPESGVVEFDYVLVDRSSLPSSMLPVTFNIIGKGTLSASSGNYLEYSTVEVFASPAKGYAFVGWFVEGLYRMEEYSLDISPDESVDYNQYGEYFGNSYRYDFEIMDTGTPIVITAVFEEIGGEKDYFDVTITDGFIYSYGLSYLKVNAIRLTLPEYLEIEPSEDIEKTLSGWTITEELEEGATSTPIEEAYSYYYFSYDTTVTPTYVTE